MKCHACRKRSYEYQRCSYCGIFWDSQCGVCLKPFLENGLRTCDDCLNGSLDRYQKSQRAAVWEPWLCLLLGAGLIIIVGALASAM